MTIETKFNVGEEVFIIYKSSVSKVKITHIGVDLFDSNINYPITNFIYYYLRSSLGNLSDGNNRSKWLEGQIFKTKQELLDSL